MPVVLPLEDPLRSAKALLGERGGGSPISEIASDLEITAYVAISTIFYCAYVAFRSGSQVKRIFLHGLIHQSTVAV